MDHRFSPYYDVRIFVFILHRIWFRMLGVWILIWKLSLLSQHSVNWENKRLFWKETVIQIPCRSLFFQTGYTKATSYRWLLFWFCWCLWSGAWRESRRMEKVFRDLMTKHGGMCHSEGKFQNSMTANAYLPVLWLLSAFLTPALLPSCRLSASGFRQLLLSLILTYFPFTGLYYLKMKCAKGNWYSVSQIHLKEINNSDSTTMPIKKRH